MDYDVDRIDFFLNFYYYLPYPCKTKANLRGWEVVFQVSPHGNLPTPSEDDYNNIDPVTYEGIFYQEQEDFGDFELEPVDLEDLRDDVETRGVNVVDEREISMLKKFHEENEVPDELPPVEEPQIYYSRDSDTDSENENEESDDEW